MIQMLNSVAAGWGEIFLLAVIQNTIFLGLVFAALHILRNAPASVRYLIALAGLIKLVLPPFMRIPAIMSIPGVSGAGYGSLIPFGTGSDGGSAVAIPETAGESLTAAGALFSIWALIVLAGLVYTVSGSFRLALRLRGARPVIDKDIPAVPGIENIRVLRSGRIAIPITVAFLPGRIYVPSAWDRWTPSCRSMVLRHEMAHLNRRDGLVLIMQIIARAIYFFHPLVAMLDRRLSEYREMACDDATVGRDRDSSVEYSRYLVEIAESVVRCPAVCGSASALIRRKNELLARVSYQLEEGRMRSISRTRVIILAAAIVLLAVSLSWYRGDASTGDGYPQPPQPPKPPKEESGSGKRMVSVVLESDGVDIDGKSIDISQLDEALGIVGGDDPGSVMVRFECADNVPMGHVRIFHEALTEAGIDKIRYDKGEGEGLALQLPPKAARDRLDELPRDLVIDVAVGSGGDIFVGSQMVKAGDLTTTIKRSLEKSPEAVVVIRNEDETTYGDFVQVLGLLKKAGAQRIVVEFID